MKNLKMQPVSVSSSPNDDWKLVNNKRALKNSVVLTAVICNINIIHKNILKAQLTQHINEIIINSGCYSEMITKKLN